MYICIRGVNYEKNENIYRVCRYEMVNGKQGDLTGSVDIDNACRSVMNVYEANGKTYGILHISDQMDLNYGFHIYELDFEKGTITEDHVVYLDKVSRGYIDIWYAAYRDGTIYALGYLHQNGDSEPVYYEITEDGYTQVDLDDSRVWEYDRILFPSYKL